MLVPQSQGSTLSSPLVCDTLSLMQACWGALHFPVGPATLQADCVPTGLCSYPQEVLLCLETQGNNEATFLCSIIQTASENVHHFTCRLLRHEVHANFLCLPSAEDLGKTP